MERPDKSIADINTSLGNKKPSGREPEDSRVIKLTKDRGSVDR